MLIAVLYKDIKKAIYLDADVILFDDINKLFCQDLKGFTLGAVKKTLREKTREIWYESLDLKNNHQYFNAGVLLINLEKWRNQKIQEKISDIIKTSYDKLRLADQDILNKCFNDNYAILPLEFNIMTNENQKTENIIIRHFNSEQKPWHILPNALNKEIKNAGEFWKYAKMTCFYETLIKKSNDKNI